MAKFDAAADAASASSPASSNLNLPQGPVEARSLSSITAIASNPPAYPRNPTQNKLEPLVLYIVRVPGSRDVFLSPLKPPTKSSVSAEAINASLYYLHVATPEDTVLLQEVEEEREQQARMRREALGNGAETPMSPPEFARMNNVRRKPVPGSGGGAGLSQALFPSASQQQQQQENYSPYPHAPDSQPPPVPPRPAPQLASTYEKSFEDSQVGDGAETKGPPPLPPRRPPLVPRENAEAVFDPLDNGQTKKTHRWSALSGYLNNRGLEGWKEKYETMSISAGRHSLDSRRPELRPHTSHGTASYVRQGSPSRSPARSPHRRPHDQTKSPSDAPGFHITLIRRDPAHGSQWNVATISTPRMDGGPIDIEISTPGYNRFLAQDEPFSLQSLGVSLPSDGRPLSLSAFRPTQPQSTESVPADPSRPRKFRRQLCVSRPLHQRDDSRGSLDLPTTRPPMDAFSGPSAPHPQAHSKLKSGYYTFISPWNGICTFSTSINGRSLKCKHMIPTPSYPGPASSASTSDSAAAPAITVAEIRFNTPFQAGPLAHQPGSSHISPFTLSQTSSFKDRDRDSPSDISAFSPVSPTGQASKRASLAQFLNPNAYTRPRSRSGASTSSTSFAPAAATHRRNPSSSSTSSGGGGGGGGSLTRPPSDDRLDLSLAREPAGGGLRGKSAKLGKLIIEDEGIKMLDLVVAACMAVWWRGYYY